MGWQKRFETSFFGRGCTTGMESPNNRPKRLMTPARFHSDPVGVESERPRELPQGVTLREFFRRPKR